MIKRPSIIIDEQKLVHNIKFMRDKAISNNLDFRPHFKTHQSILIGQYFKDLGINKITVSSIQMAEFFSKEWDDITIASTFNILELNELEELAARIKINILVDSLEVVKYLSEHLKAKVGVYIKIDLGYNRTGVSYINRDYIDELVNSLDNCSNTNFLGLLTHAGNTYNCKSKNEVIKIHKHNLMQLLLLKNKYQDKFPNIQVSIGDTPSCSIAEDFSGIDEIRPGNFVFYDVMQTIIGSCTIDQLALCIACPIISINNNRNEIVIYGGAVHLSKEYTIHNKFGKIFGLIAKSNNKTWNGILEDTYVTNLSQEHGIIKTTTNIIDKFNIGDIIYILPIHSCLSSNLLMLKPDELYII